MLRPKTIKLVEYNIRQKLQNLGFGDDFLDITSEAKAIKEKKQTNWTSQKFLNFVQPSKDNINGAKWQATEQGEMFTNHLSNY